MHFRRFPTQLRVRWFARKDEALVELLEPFAYDDKVVGLITAPIGFVSDGASIPRGVWHVVGHPFDVYLPAAIIHDFLYYTQAFPREVADEVFLRAMENCGVGWVRRKTMYYAVRVGGGWRFDNHPQRRKAKDTYATP